MKKNIRRRTEMFIETHEITIIRTGSGRQTAFCEICQTSVSFFSPEQIAVLLKINLDEVCGLIETKKFHLTGQHRFAFVCANSFNDKSKHSLEIKRS